MTSTQRELVSVETRLSNALFLRCCFILLMVTPFASAVTVAANVPQYGFQVLPGSIRQISVNIAGGTGNLINWTVGASVGGATATLDRSTNSIPLVTVTIGAVGGTCSINGAGPYTVTSTASVTIHAQSVDDPSKFADIPFNVCGNTNEVHVEPFYTQIYKGGQQQDLQSWVMGNTDETGTWSIIGQPSEGDGTISDTTFRDVVFTSGSVSGRYILQYASHANPAKTAIAIIYVASTVLAYQATPNQTKPFPCEVDAALSGMFYNVGPSQTTTTIRAVPMNTWPAGSMLLLHNEDKTGTNPTVYHEYAQISTQGTSTQPNIVCGVPDSLGNLPIVDGNGAVGASWVSPYSADYGLISTSITGGVYSNYQTTNPSPSHIVIAGLHLRYANPTYKYTPPSGGAEVAWIDGSACTNIRLGLNIVITGNDVDTCSNGIGTFDNSNSNLYAAITRYVTIEGNWLHGNGTNGSYLDRQAYMQSFLLLLQQNRIDDYNTQAKGSNSKWRGLEGIFRYNYLGDGAVREIDGPIDVQGASNYVTFEQYLGAGGPYTFTGSAAGAQDSIPANRLAAYQEAMAKNFYYGNIMTNTTSQAAIHYGGDHDNQMSMHGGNLYFYNNTVDGANQMFDTSPGGGNSYNFYYRRRIYATNKNSSVSSTSYFSFNLDQSMTDTFQTNLMHTGSFSIATPIIPQSYNGGSAQGWSNGGNSFDYLLADSELVLEDCFRIVLRYCRKCASSTFVRRTGLPSSRWLVCGLAERQEWWPLVTWTRSSSKGKFPVHPLRLVPNLS